VFICALKQKKKKQLEGHVLGGSFRFVNYTKKKIFIQSFIKNAEITTLKKINK